MNHRNGPRIRLGLALAAVAAGLCAASFAAETKPEVTRTVVLRSDLDVPGREAVMVAVELPPGSSEGYHTHPAELFAFVQRGDLTLELEGQPTRAYHVGDAIHIPAGKVHQGSNHGTVTVKLAAVFVAQKGQPLTSPAAKP